MQLMTKFPWDLLSCSDVKAFDTQHTCSNTRKLDSINHMLLSKENSRTIELLNGRLLEKTTRKVKQILAKNMKRIFTTRKHKETSENQLVYQAVASAMTGLTQTDTLKQLDFASTENYKVVFIVVGECKEPKMLKKLTAQTLHNQLFIIYVSSK